MQKALVKRGDMVLSRVGPRPPDPRGSPSPSPKFGDGEGTGIDLTKPSGTNRGRGQPNFGDFRGKNPRKTSNFGVGTGATVLGDLGDTSGTGTVQNFGDFQRIFGESPKIPESDQMPS